MTAAAAPDAMPPPDVELTPRAIHDALLPEEVGDFDRQYRQAMLEAAESLDLTKVFALLEHWRWIARSSLDPVSHRQMLANAQILLAGGEIETELWSVTKARLGL
ncbi:MAG: DUF6247 family protein [Sporichthyaceae bacterium]